MSIDLSMEDENYESEGSDARSDSHLITETEIEVFYSKKKSLLQASGDDLEAVDSAAQVASFEAAENFEPELPHVEGIVDADAIDEFDCKDMSIDDFVRIVCDHDPTLFLGKQGSDLNENLWDLVCCLAWSTVSTNEEVGQQIKTDQRKIAEISLRDIMANLPTVEYFSTKLFKHLPSKAFPQTFINYVESKCESKPTKAFMSDYIKAGGHGEKKSKASPKSKGKKNAKDVEKPVEYKKPVEEIQLEWIGYLIETTKINSAKLINNQLNPLWRRLKSGEQIGDLIEEVRRQYFIQQASVNAYNAFKSSKSRAKDKNPYNDKVAGSEIMAAFLSFAQIR